MRYSRLHSEETGATAVLIAASLIMLMGFAALVVDVGAGMNERRQDQSAADSAALAGAVEARLLGAPSDVVVEALEYVRTNLDTTYTDPEWEALWLGCVDAEKDQAPLDIYHFQPQPTPSSWTAVGTLDCISISGLGYFRVRVPEQIVETTFGRVLGVTEFNIDASAISKLSQSGVGGILPFGLTSGLNEGDHTCLSNLPSGLVVPDFPCDGGTNGNFGTLKGRLFGNPDYGTTERCNASPVGDTLSVNIAIGIDHWVTVDEDGLSANEVRDECFNEGVDTLNTDPGFPNNGLEEGLASGPVSFGFPPRLQQGSGPTENISGDLLDDEPLWDFLVSNLTNTDDSDDDDYGEVPTSCGGFDVNLQDGDYDWDGDGTYDPAFWDWDEDPLTPADAPLSWEHMQACLRDHAASNHAVMFCRSDANPIPPNCSGVKGIDLSPRFAYVPQFHEPTLGGGNDWRHIEQFKAVFLQSTIWRRTANDYKVFNPGEDCSGCNSSSYSLYGLSSWIMPDNALPEGLKGDPPPGEVGGPYKGVELWK